MSTVMERKLGELLVEDSVISSDQLEQAMDKQDGKGGSLGHILMEMGVADEWEIAAALGKRLNVPFITLSQYEIDREVLASIPRDVVLKYSIVPVDRTGDTLTVALPDPSYHLRAGQCFLEIAVFDEAEKHFAMILAETVLEIADLPPTNVNSTLGFLISGFSLTVNLTGVPSTSTPSLPVTCKTAE